MVSDSTNFIDFAVSLFTIIGSICGILALIIIYKQYRKEYPKLYGEIFSSNYKIDKNDKVDSYCFNLVLIAHNLGNLSSSIYYLDGGLYSINGVIYNKSKSCKVPIKFDGNTSKKINVKFDFNIEKNLKIARCNLRHKYPNFEDNPIFIRIWAKHTHGNFFIKGIVFRQDQIESESTIGDNHYIFSCPMSFGDDELTKEVIKMYEKKYHMKLW